MTHQSSRWLIRSTDSFHCTLWRSTLALCSEGVVAGASRVLDFALGVSSPSTPKLMFNPQEKRASFRLDWARLFVDSRIMAPACMPFGFRMSNRSQRRSNGEPNANIQEAQKVNASATTHAKWISRKSVVRAKKQADNVLEFVEMFTSYSFCTIFFFFLITFHLCIPIYVGCR